MTVMCCVCHRTRIDDQWLPVAPEPGHQEAISHSYCPVCLHAAISELESHGRVSGRSATRQPQQTAASAA